VYARLLAGHVDAQLRAAALRELSRLLNSLGPAVPPGDLVFQVLACVTRFRAARLWRCAILPVCRLPAGGE
jgi:hypothetical protein